MPVKQIIQKSSHSGITVIELMVVIAIVGLLATVALPAYQDYIKRAEINQAASDIQSIAILIINYQLSNNEYPADLSTLKVDSWEDPWGNPYEYVNHDTAPPGHRRKDKNLVPINNDFDLYSTGEDGGSSPPLTASQSRDDIVRANNGGYVGLAEKY